MNSLLNRIQALSSRERTMLITTITIGVVALAYVYVGEPVYAQWHDLHTESRALQANLAELRSLAQHRDVIEQRFADMQDSFPSAEDQEVLTVEFLQELNSLAEQSGMRVSNIKPLKIARRGRFDQLLVQLTVNSEGHQFMAFMQQLQEPSHLITCQEISMTAGRSRPPLSLTLTLGKLILH
jgi:Tfp pilus assembly protein PilO